MARLSRVERDSSDLKKMLVRIANILTDQNERIDGLAERLADQSERIDRLGDRLGERLDRLIAVTIQERTYSVERLTDIERRLTRLEEHAGI